MEPVACLVYLMAFGAFGASPVVLPPGPIKTFAYLPGGTVLIQVARVLF